jgi:hypothetical protein
MCYSQAIIHRKKVKKKFKKKLMTKPEKHIQRNMYYTKEKGKKNLYKNIKKAEKHIYSVLPPSR